MPVARRYGTPQVGTAALPRARRTAAHTAETLGANVERARGNRAETIGAIGGKVASLAIDKYGAIKERERDRADEIAVLAGENSFAEFGQSELSTVLSLKGNDAMGAPESFDKKISEFGNKVRQSMSTERQKAVFDRVFMQRRLSWKSTVEGHVRGEIEKLHVSEFVKGIENDQREAIGQGGTGTLEGIALAQQSLTRAVARVHEHADYMGMGENEIKAEVLRVQSTTHLGIAEQMLAVGNDRAARDYFEEANDAGQIQGDQVAGMKKKLEAASTEGEGLRASEDIWKRLGPANDTDPINLDTMETAAREQFKDDPKVLSATIQRLRERKAGVDAGRQDRKERITGAVWGAVAQGASLADVQRMPEYRAADGEVQARVSNYIVDQAEQAANRAYTRGVRADAALSRAEAAKQREENAKERAGWTELWRYSDPEKLAKMSDDAVISLLPDLGIEHVNRLMTKKRELAKPGAVAEAKIDDDLFKVIAREAGVDAYTPKTDDQRAELGILRNQVETQIDIEQRANGGKALSRDRKQQIMRSIVDEKVMLNTWGSDEARVASMVVNPTDQALAYVPIEQIPDVNVGEWVNVIRSTFPSAARLSRDQILTSYRKRIQRAHAAAVLGLGIEEQQRRLQGQ